MNAELLYTSAPQGLKQGSRGFCTVLSTVGMPLNIATKLESLSGYRHLHPSGTPDAAKNPVNHSHLKLTVGGRTLSVISRISDYGLDYSQRTNKLAHHVVVDSPMPTCGPAALLGDPSVIRSEWDGNCVNIPAPPTFPALSVEPAVCRAWESIAGDAGWAGVVANAWLNNASKPIFLIFSEDQSPEILPLIAEAIAILPPSKRWQATFGTYVTNLPPDVDCKVRCVVAGSDEARMASARGVVIDLTQPCGPSPSSEAATAARNGTFVGARSNVPPPHGSLDVDEEQPPAISDTIEYSEPTDFDPDRPFGTQSAGPPPTIYPGTARIAPRHQAVIKPRKRSVTIKGITAIAIGLILCLLGGVAYFVSRDSMLKSLRIVETENGLKKHEETQPKLVDSESTEKPTSPTEPDPTVSKKEPSIPDPGTEPKKPLLDPKDIVIRVSVPKYNLETPVAIRGESIESTFLSTKRNLTEEEKGYLAELQEKSKRSWRVIGKSTGEPKVIGTTDSLRIPVESEDASVFLEISYKGETWTSDRISIIDKAKKSDFKFALSNFTINGKGIPFGLPDSQISAEIEIANTHKESQQYLQSIISTATFAWHSKSTETPLSNKKQYKIEPNQNIGDIFAIARIGDGNFSFESGPLPVVSRLIGDIEIDPNDRSGRRIAVRIRDPFENQRKHQLKLGKQRLKDTFLTEQLFYELENNISEDANKIKKLTENIALSVHCCEQLKTEFVSLIRILKESKPMVINSDLVKEFEALGDFSLISIGDAVSNKQFDRLYGSLQRMTQVIKIALIFEKDYKAKINERCMPNDKKNKDEVDIAKKREEDEIEFAEWYMNFRENKLARKTITEDGFKLLQILNQVYQSMNGLLNPVIVVIEKPKLELFVSSKTAEGSYEKITQVRVPIELKWSFPTSDRKLNPQGDSSENRNQGHDNDGRELETVIAPDAKKK